MKLSKSTLDVLKNLATINLNLLIKPGKKFESKSPANTLIANIEVEETFDKQFGIYDLSKFLGVLSLYEDPELIFDDKKVTIKEGKYSTVYYGAEPDILSYPTKSITFPTSDIQVSVTASQVAKAMKAAAVLGCNTFAFKGDGASVKILVSDPAVDSSNTFELELGETDKTFTAQFKIDLLKLMPLDYEVSISSKGIAKFASKDEKTVYFLALEKTSTFS